MSSNYCISDANTDSDIGIIKCVQCGTEVKSSERRVLILITETAKNSVVHRECYDYWVMEQKKKKLNEGFIPNEK